MNNIILDCAICGHKHSQARDHCPVCGAKRVFIAPTGYTSSDASKLTYRQSVSHHLAGGREMVRAFRSDIGFSLGY